MRNTLIIAGLLAALGFLAFYLRPSDERRIEKNLAELLEALNKNEPESVPVSATIIRRASAHLLPSFELTILQPEPVRIDKSSLNSLLIRTRQLNDRIRVKLQGHTWSMREQGDYRMDVTLEAEVERQGIRETMLESFRLFWRKDDQATWRLERVETLSVIRHPHPTRLIL